jgi:two-component sensor histidine kinase
LCFYNDAYRRSIGPERHPGALGKPGREVWEEIWDIIGPQIELVMAGRGATWHENQLVPITRHGRREDVYWTYSYSPIGDDSESSGVGGVLVICTETTQRVLAERRQELLVDELHHRMKNLIMLVQAISMQTAKGASSAEQAHREFSSRLMALARAQDVLAGEQWEGSDLAKIVASAIGHLTGIAHRFRISGPPVYLPARSAFGLSLALHELATNAAKYGALKNERGSVTIAWTVDHLGGSEQLDLQWEERGGPPVQPPLRKGFGSRMIERLASGEFGAKVQTTYAREGLRCRIQAELPTRHWT